MNNKKIAKVVKDKLFLVKKGGVKKIIPTKKEIVTFLRSKYPKLSLEDRSAIYLMLRPKAFLANSITTTTVYFKKNNLTGDEILLKIFFNNKSNNKSREEIFDHEAVLLAFSKKAPNETFYTSGGTRNKEETWVKTFKNGVVSHEVQQWFEDINNEN